MRMQLKKKSKWQRNQLQFLKITIKKTEPLTPEDKVCDIMILIKQLLFFFFLINVKQTKSLR